MKLLFDHVLEKKTSTMLNKCTMMYEDIFYGGFNETT
jgi:hypothetical protein